MAGEYKIVTASVEVLNPASPSARMGLVAIEVLRSTIDAPTKVVASLVASEILIEASDAGSPVIGSTVAVEVLRSVALRALGRRRPMFVN